MKHKTPKIVTNILLLLSLLCISLPIQTTQTPNTDLIVYSYDRPLQLYALLESIETFMTGLGKTYIIYRTSNIEYEIAYQEVKETFTLIQFIPQGSNPKKDFKPLTMQCLQETEHQYILFAVDDIILKDFIDLHHAIEMLEQTNAYGFYFRLGTNINFNYPRQTPESPPTFTPVDDYTLSWKFNSWGYWGYPNTVDMTLYPKTQIIQDLNAMNFTTPNSFEGHWASRAGKARKKLGLCYTASKIINLPLNRVQHTHKNRHMDLATPQELLDIFNAGLKINIATLYKIDNNSAHMDYEPEFIKR